MRETLENLIGKWIDRKRRDVFLRADFGDLGGYDQVGRVLGQFDGRPTPVKGLRALAEEALRRLGIGTAPTRLEQAYSEGRTTQVPSGRRVAVDKRVRRKIGYNGAVMSFERAGPAPR